MIMRTYKLLASQFQHSKFPVLQPVINKLKLNNSGTKTNIEFECYSYINVIKNHTKMAVNLIVIGISIGTYYSIWTSTANATDLTYTDGIDDVELTGLTALDNIENIYLDHLSGDGAVGADDRLTLTDSVIADFIYGDYFSSGNSQVGGNDTIVLINSTLDPEDDGYGGIYGDYFAAGDNHIGGNDEITILNSTIRYDVNGDVFITGSNHVGGDDIIKLTNSTAYHVTGDNFGHFSFMTNGNNTGGDDQIFITRSQVVAVMGDVFFDGTSDSKGGSDKIYITDNSTVKEDVAGTWIIDPDNTKGGHDTITISQSLVGTSSSNPNGVYGDRFAVFPFGDPGVGVGGNDRIIIENNSTIHGDVFGDYFSGAGGTLVAGNDTISIINSTVNGSIYGEYVTQGAIEDPASSGNDTIHLTGATVEGSIYGGNGSDTLNYNGSGNSVTGVMDGEGGIDTLNFNGYSGAAIANYANFEHINLNNTTFDMGSAFNSPASQTFNVDGSSTLIMKGGGGGAYTINSSVSNAGHFNFADGKTGDQLSITGDLASSGSYSMDVDFRNETTDSIQVAGGLSGGGTIAIQDASDLSVDATANPADIVLINAGSGGSDGFVLAAANRYDGDTRTGRFTGSPFVWSLKTPERSGGVALSATGEPKDPDTPDSPDNPDSPGESGGSNTPGRGASATKPVVISELPAYATLPTFAREVVMTELDTMHQRLGELRNNNGWIASEVTEPQVNGKYRNAIGFDESKLNGWVRGSSAGFDIGDGASFEADANYSTVDIGFDKKLTLESGAALFVGFFGGISTGDFENSGSGSTYRGYSRTDVDIDAWSGGFYTTWFGTKGLYADMVLQYMDMDAGIDAVDRFTTDGRMLGGSIEVGKSFDIGNNFVIEPQAQLKVADVSWDGFHDGYNDVRFEDHIYVMGRVGARIEQTIKISKDKEAKPFLYTGINHDLGGSPSVNYVVDFDSYEYGTSMEVQVGATIDLGERFKAYGTLGVTGDFDDYTSVQGGVGVRFNF